MNLLLKAKLYDSDGLKLWSDGMWPYDTLDNLYNDTNGEEHEHTTLKLFEISFEILCSWNLNIIIKIACHQPIITDLLSQLGA